MRTMTRGPGVANLIRRLSAVDAKASAVVTSTADAVDQLFGLDRKWDRILHTLTQTPAAAPADLQAKVATYRRLQAVGFDVGALAELATSIVEDLTVAP